MRGETAMNRAHIQGVIIISFLVGAFVKAAPILMAKFDPPRQEPIVLASECTEAIEHMISLELPGANQQERLDRAEALRKGCAGLRRSVYHCFMHAKSVAELDACESR